MPIGFRLSEVKQFHVPSLIDISQGNCRPGGERLQFSARASSIISSPGAAAEMGQGHSSSMPPLSFELCASSGDMAPVIGRGVSLLHLDQVLEVAKGPNGCASAVIDQRDVFACNRKIDRTLDVLKRDATTAPFGC
jgi:hypothetical protein